MDEFRYAPATDVQAADRLLTLKKTKDVWEVIEECFKIWADKHPKEYKSFLFHVQEVRETRKRTKGFRGVTKGKDGGYIEYTMDIPQDIIYMLRVLYTPEELPMDKKFFRKFAKKFPKFKVSGKD